VADHTFIVEQMAAIYKVLPIPLYAALIDLQKAFDSIRRDHLFELLHKHKFPVDTINLVKLLYQNESSALLLNRNRSDKWQVNKGVRQGASSSPLLFNLFPEELLQRLRGHEGISFDGVEINALFYADDLILMADTPDQLQTLLGIME
jgi:hypothetical protein